MLASKVIGRYLSEIPYLGVGVLVISGPESLSIIISDWAILVGKFTRITIYIVCCVEASEVEDRVVPINRGDGSWSV